jgi:hypothetical protein
MEDDGLEELIAADIDPATAIAASEEDDSQDDSGKHGCLFALLAWLFRKGQKGFLGEWIR